MTFRNISGTARGIRKEELDIWYLSPKELLDQNIEQWVEGEKQWVSKFNIPIRNLFIYEHEGKYPGKLCFTHEDKDYIQFAMPAIKNVPYSKNIALKLFELAVNESKMRNIPRIDTYLHDCNQPFEVLKDALLETGFLIRKHRVLYCKDIKDPIEFHIERNISYKNIAELDPSIIEGYYIECFEKSLEYTNDLFPINLRKDFKRLENSYHGGTEHWKVAYYKDQPIGFIFPGMIDKKTGTFVSIGILSRYRKQGFGNYLYLDGFKMLREMGATEYLGSTSISNLPMQKLFEKNGCEKYMSEIDFVYLNS